MTSNTVIVHRDYMWAKGRIDMTSISVWAQGSNASHTCMGLRFQR